MKARASRAEWIKRVERWKDSGLSAKQFAAEIGVSAQGLTLWRWKLRQSDNRGRSSSVVRGDVSEPQMDASPKFLQLVAAPDAVSSAIPFEVVLPRGLTLRVPTGFDEPTLLRLVELLGGQ